MDARARVDFFEGKKYVKNFITNQTKSPAIVKLLGLNGEGNKCLLNLDDDLLSKHVLILGSIGMGKSQNFFHITRAVSSSLTQNDVALIFDTKGEYYQMFSKSGDYLLANGPTEGPNGMTEPNVKWNIFEEIEDTFPNDNKLIETSNEIASMLFADKIKKTSQVFFPTAARDIFAAVLRGLKRHSKWCGQDKPDNALLVSFFNNEVDYEPMKPSEDDEFAMRMYLKDGGEQYPSLLDKIVHLLSADTFNVGSLYYLSPEGKKMIDGQTQGIIAELRTVVNEIFIGYFAMSGDFSIKKAIKEENGKKIFLEYDIAQGSVLSPIYTMLVDLAIKEKLSHRGVTGHSAYFIVDEFKLLPNLKHLDDAVNFGRSLGVKFIIGLQNVSQIYNAYGKDMALNILSGFSTVFAFRVTDKESRKYLTDFFGETRKKTTYASAISSRGIIENVEKANAIEDWDILNLGVGECIVYLGKTFGRGEIDPFFIRLAPYGG